MDEIIKTLKDWQDMFEWGGFTIDFSNGVTHQGIDEGQVKGQIMLKEMLKDTGKAIKQAEAIKAHQIKMFTSGF